MLLPQVLGGAIAPITPPLDPPLCTYVRSRCINTGYSHWSIKRLRKP